MGVRHHHHLLGYRWIPVKERPAVRRVLQGIKRKFKSNPDRVRLPVTVEHLIMMRPHIDLVHNPMDLCIWAAILLGFFCLLRKANLANKTGTDMPRKLGAARDAGVPTRAAVSLDALGIMWLTLTDTKTIQFGERRLRLRVPEMPGDPICPFTWMATYLLTTEGRPADEPLFGAYVTDRAGKRKWVRLTHAVLVKRLKGLLAAVGADPKQYAGHSLRRGGATFAFAEAKLHCISIKALGDWVSNAFLVYCEVQEGLRIAAAEAMTRAVGVIRARVAAVAATTAGGRWASLRS